MNRLVLGKRSLLTGLVVGLLMLSTAPLDAERVSVTIQGGPLVVTPTPLRLAPMDTGGLDQTWTSPPSDNTWTVVDSRGTGLGWFSGNATNLADAFAAVLPRLVGVFRFEAGSGAFDS